MGRSSCCGNPNLAGDGADEWPGSLCVAQGYSGKIANLAKLQIGRIASAGQSSDHRQPTPYRYFPSLIGVKGLVAYRTLTLARRSQPLQSFHPKQERAVRRMRVLGRVGWALAPWHQLEEALDRAQMYCAPPAPTKTDSATAQLATKLSLKFVFFIVTSLVCCA